MNYVFRIDFIINNRNYFTKVISRNKQEALNEFFNSYPNVEEYDTINETGEEVTHVVTKYLLHECELKPNEAQIVSSVLGVALTEIHDYIHKHHTAHIDTIARRVYNHILEKYVK